VVQEPAGAAEIVQPQVPVAPETDPSAAEDFYPSEPEIYSEAEETAAVASDYICSLTVRCDTLLADLSRLPEPKRTLVPPDGIIFAAAAAEFYAEESVFDLLQREMRQAGVPMEFTFSPGYGSAYIEGIGNLYEKDAGALSGWTYRVNGQVPDVGCSVYPLSPDDVVEWLYSCDLGRDLAETEGGAQFDAR
jgi:hypothetical protein